VDWVGLCVYLANLIHLRDELVGVKGLKRVENCLAAKGSALSSISASCSFSLLRDSTAHPLSRTPKETPYEIV